MIEFDGALGNRTSVPDLPGPDDDICSICGEVLDDDDLCPNCDYGDDDE